MQMGAEATTKKAQNVAVCGHPAGSVYMKKWHWHTHPPATYRDIIIMLSQYELSYHVSSSGSPPLALVYADASDAEGRQSQTKQILPCNLFKLTALASNNAAQNRRCQFDASQSFARNGCPSVLPPPPFSPCKKSNYKLRNAVLSGAVSPQSSFYNCICREGGGESNVRKTDKCVGFQQQLDTLTMSESFFRSRYCLLQFMWNFTPQTSTLQHPVVL